MNFPKIQCPKCVKEYKDRRNLKKHMRGVHGLGFVRGTDTIYELSPEELEHAREAIRKASRNGPRRRRDQLEAQQVTAGTQTVNPVGDEPEIEIELERRPVSPSLLQPLEVVSPSSGRRHTLPALEVYESSEEDPDALYVPSTSTGERKVCTPLLIIADLGAVKKPTVEDEMLFSPRDMTNAQISHDELVLDELLASIQMGGGTLADWLANDDVTTLNVDLLVGDTPLSSRNTSVNVTPSSSGTTVYVVVPITTVAVYTGPREYNEPVGEQIDFCIDSSNTVHISRPSILQCGWMTDYLQEYPEASVHDLMVSWFRGERGTCPAVWRDRYIYACGLQEGQSALAQRVDESLGGLDVSDAEAVRDQLAYTHDELSAVALRPRSYTGVVIAPVVETEEDEEEVEEVEIVELNGSGSRREEESSSNGESTHESSVGAESNPSEDLRVFEDISEDERDSPQSPDASEESDESHESDCVCHSEQ